MNLKNYKRSEATEQIRLFDWAMRHEEYVPELQLIFHVPNEGKRTNGELLKAMGLKKGIPDICLPAPKRGYAGLFIEMKYGTGRLTKEQRETMEKLREQGYKATVCYTFEDAREVIRHYLARGESFDLVNCEHAPKIFGRCEGVAVDWAPCRACKFYKND